MIVRDVGQFGAVELGDDELFKAEVSTFQLKFHDNPSYALDSILDISAGKANSEHEFHSHQGDLRSVQGRITSTTREGGTYRMATAQRLDIEESKDLVALKELERRDIT